MIAPASNLALHVSCADDVRAHRTVASAPLRLLHVAAGNLYGGIERTLVTTARKTGGCAGLHHEYAVCFPGQLQRELQALEARVHNLGAVRVRYPWTMFHARRALRHVVQSSRIDCVIFHGCWPLATLGWQSPNSTCRAVYWAHEAVSGRHWIERFGKRRHVDHIIANSQWVRDSAMHWRPGVPAAIVGSSADLPATILPRSGSIRRELGVNSERVVIAQVSRLDPCKGHRNLIEAARRLQLCGDELPDWEIWIVGGPQRAFEETYLRSLHHLIAEYRLQPRIRWLGQRADVLEILADADILCQPNSTPEGLGVVFLEAMAQGLPVVSFDFGGATEVVPRSAGILVEPGNLDALSAVLKQLISDPGERQRFQQAGPAHARRLADPIARLNELHRALSQHSRAATH